MSNQQPISKTRGLALSGGGYRATLFGLGSLWRLNELGMLQKFNRITAVSGGSITLGYLALNWRKLNFNDSTGVASNFKQLIADPLQDFCSKTLDLEAGISGLFSLKHTIGDKVAAGYDRDLFFNNELKALPSGKFIPEFIFYATNYVTGSNVRITREEVYDYKIGTAMSDGIRISTAVGASSAFPPIFSPVILDSSQWGWKKTKYAKLYDRKEFRDRLVLCDGGLYDNLGLEAIWKEDESSRDHFDEVFVCDAGAPLTLGFDMGTGFWGNLLKKTGLKRNWVAQLNRMSNVMIEQQRALRKRQLINNYKEKRYGGTYWGITTEIEDYEVKSLIAEDNAITRSLGTVPTRLNAFNPEIQGRLINWGYALVDAAIRKHVDNSINGSKTLPIPEYPLLDKKD